MNMEQTKLFAGRGIYFFRRRINMKQTELANYLNMTRQNLSDIENDKTRISREDLALIAQKLNTTPEELEHFSERSAIFNNQNQQGEQYNNCTVGIPESLLASIQQSLVITQETLRFSIELLKDLKDELKALKSN